MSPRIVDREEKRHGLIDAAARVFVNQGFSTSRVADIAIEAGVGKGTVYEYFDSKEELFFAVFEWITDEFRGRVDRLLAEEASALDHLIGVLRSSADFITEHRDLYSMNLDFWAASRGGAFEHRFSDTCESMYRDYRGLLAGIIRRGQQAGDFVADLDADGLAIFILSGLDGLGVQYWFDDTIDPKRSVDAFAEALCRGLCEEGS